MAGAAARLRRALTPPSGDTGRATLRPGQARPAIIGSQSPRTAILARSDRLAWVLLALTVFPVARLLRLRRERGGGIPT
ncbi:MAG: hypothetical protein IT204_25755 [Fimbriimonadaceae bacterium]|nr:hypothetical protein [Fimbriimonadaceae bacterium]